MIKLDKSTWIAAGSAAISIVSLFAALAQPTFMYLFSDYPDRLAITLKQIDHFSSIMSEIGELQADIDSCAELKIDTLYDCKNHIYGKLIGRNRRYFGKMPVGYVIMPDDLVMLETKIFDTLSKTHVDMTCRNLKELENNIVAYIESVRNYFDWKSYNKPGKYLTHNYRVRSGVPACMNYSEIDYLKDISVR